jgi:hypothetical protein
MKKHRQHLRTSYLSVGDPGARLHGGDLPGLLPHQLELHQREDVRVGEAQQDGHRQTLQLLGLKN